MMNKSAVIRVGFSGVLFALTTLTKVHAQVPPPPGPAPPAPPPAATPTAKATPPPPPPAAAPPPAASTPADTGSTGAAPVDILAGGNPDVQSGETAAPASGAEDAANNEAPRPTSPGQSDVAPSDQDTSGESGSGNLARKQELRRHGAFRASTGLFQTHSADSGPVGTFRFGLLTSYMSASGFLCPQCETFDGGPAFLEDDVSRVGAHVQLSVTPLPYLEAYWAIHSTATSNSLGTPQLLQVLGDTTWGVKGFVPVPSSGLFHVGGALELWMLNGAGSIGIDNASVALRALGTADFTRWETEQLPLRVNANLSYVFDNSGNLVQDAEVARRERVSRIERFGLNINRVDRLVPAIGVEGMFDHVHPFLEWSVDIPVNRQGYRCVVADLGASDQCLENYQTFAAAPSRLTLGARGYALLDGLSAIAAFDIATGGVNAPFWEEVQPEAPWNLYLGLSFAVDTVPAPTPEVATRPVLPPRPVDHVILGQVLEAGVDDVPVADAVVRYDGMPFTGMVTDEQGRFESRPLEPGEYRFQVSAVGYEPGTCGATISPRGAAESAASVAPVAAGDVGTAEAGAAEAGTAEAGKRVTTLVCELKAKPKVGNIQGVVLLADAGTPVADAKVTVTDKLGRSLSLQVDELGSFRFENVPPGPTNVRIAAAGYLTTTRVVDVPSGQDLELNLDLVQQPVPPNVVVNGQQIVFRAPLEFRTGSKELLPSTAPLLDELAMVLLERPELAKLEVQAHTTNEAPPVVSMQLSQERAEAIVAQLEQRGVASGRLTAQGYGASQPVAPHTTAAGRKANERVQIVVLEAPSP